MIGIDLFAGAGGMSYGARAAGIDIQIVVEADPNAAKTYMLNHTPSLMMYDDDIRKFEYTPLKRFDEPVVVFGGPPCQGFSTSNQRTRSADNEQNWLFKEFFRVIKMYSPDWVVFENVKGILETDSGKFVTRVKECFDELGYKCSDSILQADDFGVPQKRSRYFIVASKAVCLFSFPTPLLNVPVSVDEAIGDLPSLENGASKCYLKYDRPAVSNYSSQMRKGLTGCSNHLVTRNNSIVIDRYSHIPQGGNWMNIPDELMGNYKNKLRCHTGIYKRLDGNKPSVVIGNYRKNMLIHPYQNRGLSVREAARLQSFPDDFKFWGSIGFQQQQVGNAVPPLLSKAIFESVLSQT